MTAHTAYYPNYTQGRLDPQTIAVIDQLTAGNAPPIATMTPREARAEPQPPAWTGAVVPGIGMMNVVAPHAAGHVPLRVYSPEGQHPPPILVYFHGGGFVAGTLDEYDPLCTMLASGARCIVVSVDYRLAPEHKHPAAVDDALTAVRWIAAHAAELNGDPDRIAVVGDSAGANLATVVSLIAKEEGYPRFMFQALICPWVDSSSFDTDSFRFFGDGLWLSRAAMCWYRDHYLAGPEQALLPRVSPLLAHDVRGLPPALVITAEYDVLRDQGEAYAGRLREAGVEVRCTRYPGMLHDFYIYPGAFDLAKLAIAETAAALREAFTNQ